MKKYTFFAFSASLLLVAAASADTLNLSGNTAGAPTFVRPTESGARSFFTAPYSVYQFNVSTSGAFTFTLNAVDPASYDTFLHLFVNAFNPADMSDPALNFLAANDDRDASTTNSGLTSLSLNAGANYFLVIDGFSLTDAGAFNAIISGPGAITVVPEPSTVSILSLAIILIAILTKGRQNAAV